METKEIATGLHLVDAIGRSGDHSVRVLASHTHRGLDGPHVAEAAGWLLGWLAEHAPEERAKLIAVLAAGELPVQSSTYWEREANKARRERDEIEDQRISALADRDRLKADRDSLEVERGRLYCECNAAQNELAAIRDAVIADCDGDDDGWPTSLDAVRDALRTWGVALGDSQRESSKLASKIELIEAERDRAAIERDKAFGQRLSAFGAEFGLPPIDRAVPADVSDLHRRVMGEISKRSEGAEKELAAIADAVGLGGTRTRWEGQLLGKVEGLVADVSDLRAANRALTNANHELRAVLSEVPAQREAAAVATYDGIRAMFAGCKLVIHVPDVTRG